jgi:hypothetical protein
MTQLMERAAPARTAAPGAVRSPGNSRAKNKTFSLREVGITAALSVGWGALLWLFIGGAVELFGNPGVAP